MAAAKVSASQQEEKDQVLDSLYWVKQLIAIGIGLAAGTSQLTGFIVIIGFGIIISSVSLFYAWQVAKANDLEPWDIVSEAFGPAFFCFMLCWILAYTFTKPIN